MASSMMRLSRNFVTRITSRGMAWTPVSQTLPRRTAQELYAEIRDLTKQGGDYTGVTSFDFLYIYFCL